MKYVLSFILLVIITINGVSQDNVFSQYWNNPHYLNPSLSGLIASNVKISASNRTQWKGIMSKPFETNNLNVAFNLGTEPGTQNSNFGIDINFMNDIAGAGGYGLTQIGTGFSYNKRFGSSQLGAGIQFDYNQIGVNMTKLIFDPSLNNNESLTHPQLKYFDMSFGLNYVLKLGDRSSIATGVAGFHINRPSIALIDISNESKQRRWSYYASSELLLDKYNKIYLDLAMLYTSQGLYEQLMIGGLLSKQNSSGENLSRIYVGLWYRVNDAIIPSFQLRWRTLKFGFSYDVNVSDLSKKQQFSAGAFCVNISHGFNFKNRKTTNYYCPIFADL